MREDGKRIFDNAYNLGKTYITWLRFTASYHELSKYTKESNGVLCPRSLIKCLLSLVILSGLATKSNKILFKIAKLKDSSNENQFRAWCASVHAAVFMHVNDQLTPTCEDRVISVQLGQYQGCWCPGSLRRQDIRSNDIDYVGYVDPGLTWGMILSTCVTSMWSNDIKSKYMFMFPLQNLARKELTAFWCSGKIKITLRYCAPKVSLCLRFAVPFSPH